MHNFFFSLQPKTKACVSPPHIQRNSLNSPVALMRGSQLEIFGAKVFTWTSVINIHLYLFFSIISGSKQVHFEMLHSKFCHSTSRLQSYINLKRWLKNYSYQGIPVTLRVQDTARMPISIYIHVHAYRQCFVLAGMKLVNLHKAQANVGPHKKALIRAQAGADKSSWKIIDTKNQ